MNKDMNSVLIMLIITTKVLCKTETQSYLLDEGDWFWNLFLWYVDKSPQYSVNIFNHNCTYNKIYQVYFSLGLNDNTVKMREYYFQ